MLINKRQKTNGRLSFEKVLRDAAESRELLETKTMLIYEQSEYCGSATLSEKIVNDDVWIFVFTSKEIIRPGNYIIRIRVVYVCQILCNGHRKQTFSYMSIVPVYVYVHMCLWELLLNYETV